MNARIIICATIVAIAIPTLSTAADMHNQAEVAERGRHVMPFDLKATVHVFTKTSHGGIQRVVTRHPHDLEQIALIREHLRRMRSKLLQGDFSDPAQIHGNLMPGLSQLRAAGPGRIAIGYADVGGGGELTFKTSDNKLIEALHLWFDAQVSDHGPTAMEGNDHHRMNAPNPM
jgi:hypothetical protein